MCAILFTALAPLLFFPFLDDKTVNIIGVEAGGKGVNAKMEHCASLTGGRPGVLHGNRTYLLQDDDGQILEGFSISAGLDYPGIGPEQVVVTKTSLPSPRRWVSRWANLHR